MSIKLYKFSSACYCRHTSFCAKERPEIEHVFNKVPFTNLAELFKELKKSVICRKYGVIAINKPYGLRKVSTPLDGDSDRSKRKIVLNSTLAETNHLTFTDALPLLAKDLKQPDLELVKLPERHISGVSLLTSNTRTKSRIQRNLKNAENSVYTYLAICIGKPIINEDLVKLGLTFLPMGDKNAKKAIFVKNVSKNSMKNQLVTTMSTRTRLLSYNETLNVSLVQLETNRNKWHSVRLYCATRMLSPIIGDNMMSSRVKNVNGKLVLANPKNPATDMLPVYPENVLNALELSKETQHIMPLHLHLTRVALPKFSVQRGFTIIAKPSSHFSWSCEKLELRVPDYFMKNHTGMFKAGACCEGTIGYEESESEQTMDYDVNKENV